MALPLQFSLYLLPLVGAAAISTALAAFVFRNRHKRTAPQLLGILVAAAVWSTADAARIAAVDPVAKLLWHNVRFFGSTLVVLALLLHALEYTNREELITRGTVAGLASVFAVTNVLVWTEIAFDHGLMIADYELVSFGSVLLVHFEYGPWFYVNAAYSYALLVCSAALYSIAFVRRSGTYRLQTGGLLLGTFVPWGMNAVYLLGWSVVDLTAFGFTVTGVVFVWQFSRLQLLDIVPVARSTVINQIENGYLVLDTQGRVLDVNDAGAALLGRSRDGVIGATVEELWADYPDVIEKFGTVRNTREDVTLVRDGERRDYDVDISPVYDDHDQYVGRVVLVRDVTEERRRQRKLEQRTRALERQNERLDQFASVVSHDLRNPLAVAKGNLELAAETGTPESFDRVEEGLERIEEITEDVLALARQGGELTSVESVDLEAVSEEAWRTVETEEATLVVETDRTVRADPSRLRRALENLFRNSLDHGSPDATVRVGDLDGGFYVEDDGPGIPPAERDRVLEPGVSTQESGTGFGLSIVSATAEAHGWSFEIEEGADGGARFEFLDLENSPPIGFAADADDDATDHPDTDAEADAVTDVDADANAGASADADGATDPGPAPAESDDPSADSNRETATDTDTESRVESDGPPRTASDERSASGRDRDPEVTTDTGSPADGPSN